MIKSVLKSSFSLLHAELVELNKNWHYSNVTSIFYRIYAIREGRGYVADKTGKVVLEPGFLYLIPSFTTCNYVCDGHLSQYYITFSEVSSSGTSLFAANRKIFKLPATDRDLYAIERVIVLNPGRGLKLVHNPTVFEKHAALQQYQVRNQELPASAFMETNGLLLQLIARFMAFESFTTSEEKPIHSKVADAINYMLANLERAVTVSELSRRACLHADYFSRLFQENTGERPLDYLRSRRIERARLLLSTTDLPVAEIARASGFESVSYFARTFKDTIGMTARAYRLDNRMM